MGRKKVTTALRGGIRDDEVETGKRVKWAWNSRKRAKVNSQARMGEKRTRRTEYNAG